MGSIHCLPVVACIRLDPFGPWHQYRVYPRIIAHRDPQSGSASAGNKVVGTLGCSFNFGEIPGLVGILSKQEQGCLCNRSQISPRRDFFLDKGSCGRVFA
jgi:hypothetical protein